MDHCDPIQTDSVAHSVSWQGGADLSRLAGTAIRLKIKLRSTDLYAFQFQ